MKIFIICCLLFIHVNMCIYIRGFRVSIRVSGIRSGFGYPRVWFWWWISTRIGFRGGFGFRFRVSVLGAQRLHPIRTRPVAILIEHGDNYRQHSVIKQIQLFILNTASLCFCGTTEHQDIVKQKRYIGLNYATKMSLTTPYLLHESLMCYIDWDIESWIK